VFSNEDAASSCWPLKTPLVVEKCHSKYKRLLLRDQKDWCAAGRNRNCIPNRLFAAFGSCTLFESLHRREIDLSDAVEGRFARRRTEYPGRDNLGFAGKFRDRHGHMLSVVGCFEGFDILWAWINHH
jgi:hypothetical protein